MGLGLRRLPTDSPDDTRALAEVSPSFLQAIRAIVGKTEGNGCVNDFSRGLARQAWRHGLAEDAIAIFSGGTEGVLSPHVTALADLPDLTEATGGLAIGVARTPSISDEAIGTMNQAVAVADAVNAACRDAEIYPEDLQLVLVKCPLWSGTMMTNPALGSDPYESMGLSRGASALGVGLATHELDRSAVLAGLAGDRSVYSNVASTSAGVESRACEVVAIGPSRRSASPLHIRAVVMSDPCDATPVLIALEEIRALNGRVVQVFAKAEAPPDGRIRGWRHTMLTDSDIHHTRHARAAVAGLLAGLIGDPAIYVSGGAEHQGPPGGGPVALVFELPETVDATS